MLEEKITGKDENYYVNQCNGSNKVNTGYGYGNNFSTFHEVEDKVVELQQHSVVDADGDVMTELDNVIIRPNKPF